MAAYECRVVDVREGLVGGGMSGDKLELLDGNGRDGRPLKSITSVEVKGRSSLSGVEGLPTTFERARS